MRVYLRKPAAGFGYLRRLVRRGGGSGGASAAAAAAGLRQEATAATRGCSSGSGGGLRVRRRWWAAVVVVAMWRRGRRLYRGRGGAGLGEGAPGVESGSDPPSASVPRTARARGRRRRLAGPACSAGPSAQSGAR